MTYSISCLNLVKRSEGLRLTAYQDAGGIWTIGYGHTHGVHEGDTITIQRAEGLLTGDLCDACSDLTSILPTNVHLTQGQFDALVSLSFNMRGGARALPQVAPRLWANLKAGDMAGAAREFLDMDHALVDGKLVELPGLKARREAESAMFIGMPVNAR